MKKFGFTLMLGALAAGSTQAESSVTLYGIVDQSIRFTTNADASNNNKMELTNGAVTNSRFGLRGEESLGSDLKAVFRLENGFDPDTGKTNQNGRLFGRYAYVGLSGHYGTIRLGRSRRRASTSLASTIR